MKQLAFLLLLILSSKCIAEPKDPLDISNWDFNAIKASYTLFEQSKTNDDSGDCPATINNINWIEQKGEAVYSSGNCYAYVSTADGWITKYDSQTKQALAKIRVGLEIANASLSTDNKFLLVGNRQPADLVILNTKDLSVERIIPVKNRKGVMSPVAKVRTAGEEHGFIVAPQNFSKIWKISYQNPAPIGFGDGWNHDYRCMKEHVNKSLFPVKRLKIGQQLQDFQIDSTGIFLVGKDNSGKGLIMDLDLSRVVSHPDIPAIESGLLWKVEKGNQLAVLSKDKKAIHILSNVSNPRKWQEIKSIPVNNAITIASCPSSESIWVSTQGEGVQKLDKKTLSFTESIPKSNKTPVTHIKCLANGQAMFYGADNQLDFIAPKPL